MIVVATIFLCTWHILFFFSRQVFLARRRDKDQQFYAVKVVKKNDVVNKNMIEQGICDWLIICFKLFLFISVIDFKLSVQLLGIAFSYSYCRAGCTRNFKKSIHCQPVLLFSIKGQNFSGRYLSVWNHCLNNFGHYLRPEVGLKPETHHSKLLISWVGISRDAAKTRFDHGLSPSSLHIPN